MTKNCRFQSAEGKKGRVITARLFPGTDFFEGIREICKKHDIKQGYISCAIGTFSKVTFVIAIDEPNAKAGMVYCDPIVLEGPIEVVSCQGLICQSEKGTEMHVHATFSTEDFRVWDGHLLEKGNPVLVTVEVIINEVDGVIMGRKFDPEVNWPVFAPEEDLSENL